MQTQVVQQEEIFLKRSRRFWYWLLLVYLILTTVLDTSTYALLPMVYQAAGTVGSYALLAAILGFSLAGWVVFLIVYATSCTLNVHRVLMYVWAGFQLLAVIGRFIGGHINISILSHALGSGDAMQIGLLGAVNTALNVLFMISWIAGLLIIVFGHRSSTPLRVAALLLALYRLYTLVNIPLSTMLTARLYEQLGSQGFAIYSLVLSIVTSVVFVGLTAFFFGALTFGKQKKSKTAVKAA